MYRYTTQGDFLSRNNLEQFTNMIQNSELDEIMKTAKTARKIMDLDEKIMLYKSHNTIVKPEASQKCLENPTYWECQFIEYLKKSAQKWPEIMETIKKIKNFSENVNEKISKEIEKLMELKKELELKGGKKLITMQEDVVKLAEKLGDFEIVRDILRILQIDEAQIDETIRRLKNK